MIICRFRLAQSILCRTWCRSLEIEIYFRFLFFIQLEVIFSVALLIQKNSRKNYFYVLRFECNKCCRACQYVQMENWFVRCLRYSKCIKNERKKEKKTVYIIQIDRMEKKYRQLQIINNNIDDKTVINTPDVYFGFDTEYCRKKWNWKTAQSESEINIHQFHNWKQNEIDAALLQPVLLL